MEKYITTPIYYLNGLPHIGHAYTSILGDVMKKFEQMRGNNVFYSTGTDEHGQKINIVLKKADCLPKNFCKNKVIISKICL